MTTLTVHTNTFEQWRARVTGSTYGLTEAQIDAIARRCRDKEAYGKTTCVWHECAAEFNQLDRCNCVPCRVARGEG